MKFSQRILVLFLLLCSSWSHAQRESWYQQVWCEGAGGKVEVELPEGPRVDCMTATHAIEMDFARKWPEAVGQSLYYSHLTGLKAGIVLILRTHNDIPHLKAAKETIKAYNLPITLWPLGP